MRRTLIMLGVGLGWGANNIHVQLHTQALHTDHVGVELGLGLGLGSAAHNVHVQLHTQALHTGHVGGELGLGANNVHVH